MNTTDKTKTYEESEQRTSGAGLVPIRLEGIGTRIAAVADLLGSRKNAASAANSSVDSLQRWIRDENMPAFDAAARLCLAAGVRLHWLATGEEPMLMSAEQLVPQQMLREPAVPYGTTAPAPGGTMDRKMDLLADAVRLTEDVLHKFGIRQRANASQFAELVRFMYGELAAGAAEDAASAALERILDIARTPR